MARTFWPPIFGRFCLFDDSTRDRGVDLLAAMGAWTLATLGFRELWKDVGCGGPVCDQMRADAAAGRHLLVIAWVVGMIVGAPLLFAIRRLNLRRRS